MRYCYRPCCIRNGGHAVMDDVIYRTKKLGVNINCVSAEVSGQYFGKFVV